MMILLAFAALGLAIGFLGGVLGIGGGVLVIPCLTLMFGFTQKQAVGTSLGMLLPPIGIFAFLEYYRAGNVNLKAAMIMAGFFAVGALLGSKAVTSGRIPENSLRMIFAIFMLYVGGSMLFKSDRTVWSVLNGISVSLVGMTIFGAFKLIGRKWDRDAWPTIRESFVKRIGREQLHDYEI